MIPLSKSYWNAGTVWCIAALFKGILATTIQHQLFYCVYYFFLHGILIDCSLWYVMPRYVFFLLVAATVLVICLHLCLCNIERIFSIFFSFVIDLHVLCFNKVEKNHKKTTFALRCLPLAGSAINSSLTNIHTSLFYFLSL